MLKGAVIGVGIMGKNHARLLAESDEVDLVAVSDVNSELAKKISKKHGCRPYADYVQMLVKEKPDFVCVVVPTHLHKKVTLDAIERNIHVLVEKPIAGKIDEAKQIIKFAADKGVKLMVGHVERFNPAVIELKRRLSDAGSIFKVDFERVGPYTKRVSHTGVISDLAVHDLDILRYLIPGKVSNIHAFKLNHLSESEDSLCAMFNLSGQIICTLNVNRLTPTRLRRLTITGDRGMFRLDYLNQNLYFYENSTITSSPFLTDIQEGKMTKFHIEKKEPLRQELMHFIGCVSSGNEPIVTGNDGIEALQLALRLNGDIK